MGEIADAVIEAEMYGWDMDYHEVNKERDCDQLGVVL